MARIRSIKPEFWVSEQVAECSMNARLTFIGIWTFSDDNGVHPAKPKTLKAELFPMDGVSASDVAGWVGELVRVGLLAEFTADGVAYWHVTGWKHQKIDRPSCKHPEPPGVNSARVRRVVGEGSTTTRLAPPPGKERIGKEGNGMESKGLEGSGSSPAPLPASHPEPRTPTAADQACTAIRAAGVRDATANAKLNALLDDGASVQELVSVATELVSKGKPRFALLLSTAMGRRSDAAQQGAVPMAASGPWHATRKGIEDKGQELGIGRWDETAFSASLNEQQSTERGFAAYEARVMAAAVVAPQKATAALEAKRHKLGAGP